MLDCGDKVTQNATRTLLVKVLKNLSLKGDMLKLDQIEIEEYVPIPTKSGDDQRFESVKKQVPLHLSARYIDCALGILNTQAAKNWIRVDNFLQVFNDLSHKV